MRPDATRPLPGSDGEPPMRVHPDRSTGLSPGYSNGFSPEFSIDASRMAEILARRMARHLHDGFQRELTRLEWVNRICPMEPSRPAAGRSAPNRRDRILLSRSETAGWYGRPLSFLFTFSQVADIRIWDDPLSQPGGPLHLMGALVWHGRRVPVLCLEDGMGLPGPAHRAPHPPGRLIVLRLTGGRAVAVAAGPQIRLSAPPVHLTPLRAGAALTRPDVVRGIYISPRGWIVLPNLETLMASISFPTA